MQGHYYSWDVRLATFSLAVLSLLLYYKRYHLTKDVIDSPRCGGWLNYLPVCLCCAKDTPMKAMENEVISNSTFNLLKLITFKEAMEIVIGQDSTDNKKKVEISTQTDFDVYSKFPPQPGNNGTEEQLRQYNDLHGNTSVLNLSKTVSKLFNYSKTKPDVTSGSLSEPTPGPPLATPESESSPETVEMSVRKPLLPQMDSKLDLKAERSHKEDVGNKRAAKENRVEVTAVLHSN